MQKKENAYQRKIVPKVWGREDFIVNKPEYCGKVLHVNKDHAGSLHYHVDKDETFLLVSGYVTIKLKERSGEDYYVELGPMESLHIPPGQLHQIIGREYSVLIEFSTQDFDDDSYRVERAF